MQDSMHAKICFIGAGNMAQSLIGGLIASGYAKEQIVATDPNADIQKSIIEQYGIDCLADNNQAIANADIIVLAVKPQILRTVCQSIEEAVQAKQPMIISVAAGIRCDDIDRWLGVRTVCQSIEEAVQAKQPMIISVAAGIRCDDIDRWLGGNLAIVRTMPNTPALIQTGATGLFANAKVSEDQQSQAEHIMRATGITVWVDRESQIDTVTALSGSGPAYYFLFMEAMQNAAVEMGLDEKTAHLLTMQTALGAAKMVMESHQDCATLRQKVTSPNGTTEKAIQSFEADGLRQTVAKAMQAAQTRAGELAKELGEA